MSSDFFIQATNLLAQQLAGLAGEEIYVKTSCMEFEYRQVVAVLDAMVKMSPRLKTQIDKILPLIENLGKAAWPRTELTDLGLRVGQRNVETINDTEETIIDDKEKTE
jgi:hypothetical protein